MGVERLQLCVRFCNVCGLFPFRMILDPISGRFKRFKGHWRHPANWWFLLLVIIHLILLCFCVYFILFLGDKSSETIPVALAVVLILFFLNLGAYISIPRFILLHLRHLKTAVEIFDRIDRVLDKISHAPCTSRRQTLIAIGWSISVVGLHAKKILKM